jgi:hypothetical protein
MDAEPVPVEVASLPKFSNDSRCAKADDAGRSASTTTPALASAGAATLSVGRTFTGCARAGTSGSNGRRQKCVDHRGTVSYPGPCPMAYSTSEAGRPLPTLTVC